MLESVLIANRGEIACRVMRTCRRLGIRTVAVFSEADAGALHVAMADGALPIGPAAPRESYLNIDAVMAAAKKSDAAAIHPGYGFLSENPAFAETCERAGVVFIGPPVEAIRAMGSKSAAKAIMADAGVPILPGYHGAEQDVETLREAAAGVGYPFLLKPSAGGGGRGMRRVEREQDLAFEIDAARREARAAFGDDHLLIEKYLARPRHVEVQVFADKSGNLVHLFERDCSVQRRHQKVIEEAPAPGLTTRLRDAMGATAVAAARAIGYVGAGTVEFLLDGNGKFYFMEMNTRLQVEHPVTEMITGQDLVEWQLRVAAGENLPLAQQDIRIDGHAIEARVYAEDPARDFMPAAGRLAHFRLPAATCDVRIDSGVRADDEVSAHYDPMIAKLITWGADRGKALDLLVSALAQVQIAGVATNVSFLSAIAAHPSFVTGAVDTGLIDHHRAELIPEPGPPPVGIVVLAALSVACDRSGRASIDSARRDDPTSPWATVRGWRLNEAARETVVFEIDDDTLTAHMVGEAVQVDGRDVSARAVDWDQGRLWAVIDGQDIIAPVFRQGADLTLFAGGETWRLRLFDTVAEAEAHAGETATGDPASPMPGVVAAILVKPGATVEKGAPLVVIEAMKVEHTIRAPADGTIETVNVAVGDSIEEGTPLVAFHAAES